MEELAIFYTVIKDLFDGRVYPDAVPASNNAADPAQWPAVRYILTSGKVIATNCYQDYSPPGTSRYLRKFPRRTRGGGKTGDGYH